MDKYLIPSVTHACQIFRILAASSQGMTMHDIEQQLDLPRTTLFRLLRTLCHEQMLEKKGKIYRCGNELTRLGLHMINADHMHQLAIPHIQRLALKSGHTAHLAVPNNGKVLIVEVVDSPNPLMVSKRPGGQAQMHCSSTGKVFLAFLYRENLDLYIAEHPLERHTAYTITDKASLEAELQRITALGYAVDERELNENVRCLAVPVRDNRGIVVAAVGITAPAVTFSQASVPEVAELAKEAARGIYRDAYQLRRQNDG
ncbi:MAG: transcriptional regulator [Alteromonadaceae bacterium]|nr:transcriptional regulator [Alteromonadaceae bacterium]MEC7690152.1 IclR family transcriptional regulator [Pseudomonadota bacterium]